MLALLLQTTLLFAEPDFPVVDAPTPLPELAGAAGELRVSETLDDLARDLEDHPRGLLVWRHGSAFPAELWSPFLAFLEGGGSFLYLGGEPFTRVVTGEPGAREVGPRTVSLLKELDLNQCTTIHIEGEHELDAAVLRYEGPGGGSLLAQTLPRGARVYALQPRLSQRKVIEEEDGSAGTRDALVRPLASVYSLDEPPRFPLATGVFCIDRLHDRFAGGRWTFRTVSEPPTETELNFLLREAARAPFELSVEPRLGCFHEGEEASVTISLERPLTEEETEFEVAVVARGPIDADEPRSSVLRSTLSARKTGSVELALPGFDAPGLYLVTARVRGLGQADTGFWIFDRALFESGSDLSFDSWTLRRDGVPEPVIGTTTMSNTVHRDFLARPNAWVWDDTFQDLEDLGLNLVRTGVWTAWRDFLDEEGNVEEPFLRALEAYYLTARRHGIPVLFTFFAFVPESFDGVSPYFDPASLAAQENYLGQVAARFGKAREMLWDLINEPSFANPDRLWFCRPNGDEFELEAFRAWLAERHTEADVRARWRLLPDEELDVPRESDYAERFVMEDHRPYRAREYSLFAQFAFSSWVERMVGAIRGAGSRASVTVGQDEGGLNDRPSPLLHHRPLDYTSIHTWWYNDALLWDGLLAKVAGKPLLASETGVMQRELLSGESIRTPESSSRLLSRKLALAFAAGAFGVVNWAWEINPYMASDNEVAIGVRRADGSYKPELDVLRRFARFFERTRELLVEPEPAEVALVLPASDHYSPRELQARGTRRALELLVQQGVDVRVVHEHDPSALGTPRLIVLPACRGISSPVWRAIQEALDHGAHLMCSGWFEADDAELPALRIGARRARLERYEHEGRLHYPLEITESAFRAREAVAPRPNVTHHAWPIEWADRSSVQVELYREVLVRVLGDVDPRPEGLTVRRLPTSRGELFVVVNERAEPVRFRDVTVPAGEGHLIFLDERGELAESTLPAPR